MVGAAENHHQSLIAHRKLRLGWNNRYKDCGVREDGLPEPGRATRTLEPIYDRGSWSRALGASWSQ